MNNPFDIFRRLIARFPRGRRFFSYLMALRLPGAPGARHWTPARHALLTVLVHLGANALGIWAVATLMRLGRQALA